MPGKLKIETGFTMIELLVVIAVIGLISSLILVSVVNSRQKARDTRRLADMAQVNTGLALYHATYQGYPAGSNGFPLGMTPTYMAGLPKEPLPADGACIGVNHTGGADPVPSGVPYNNYYYVASGTPVNGVYPSYSYYFCLGYRTSSYQPGLHYMTPTGVQ